MHVDLYGVILFLHITVAIIGFVIAGVLHASLHALARAGTVSEIKFWGRLVHRLDPLFPLVALLLLGFGAWLIHLSGGDFKWSTGWVLTAVISLVVIEGVMGATVAPRAKAVVKAIEEAADGPVPDDIRRTAYDPMLWHLSHVASVGFVGIVFLMAAKPNGAWSVIIVIIGALLGVALSAAQLRALPGAKGALPGQRVSEPAGGASVAS